MRWMQSLFSAAVLAVAGLAPVNAQVVQQGVTVAGTPAADECVEFVSRGRVQSAKRPCGNFIDIRDYGAIAGDGIDDTDEIRAALAAATGRTLYIPTGDWNIGAASGTEVLLWDQPMRWLGDGFGKTRLIVSAATPNTVDGIRVDPADAVTGTQLRGWSFEGIQVTAVSSAGKYGFHIDLDDVADDYLAEFSFRQNFINGFSNRAFSMNKGPDGGTPANIDGFFTSTIELNVFAGGVDGDHVVHLDNSGDSLRVRDNIMTSWGVGVYTRPIGGAARQTFADNNITSNKGMYHIVGGTQVTIRNSQMEMVSDVGSLDCMVTVEDTTEFDLLESNLNTHGNGNSICLSGIAQRVRISGNVFTGLTAAGGKVHFSFGASVVDIVQDNNTFVVDGLQVAGPMVSDSSSVGQPLRRITPTQITSSQDNYAPTGILYAEELRLSSNSAVSITGLTSGTAGRELVVSNVGAFTITFVAESVASTAANRFRADMILGLGQSARIRYDGVASRWRFIGLTTTQNVPYTFANAAASTANIITQTSEDGAASGPQIDLTRISASPAANDLLGGLRFVGRDSAGLGVEYAKIVPSIVNPADGSEGGRINWQTIVAGTLATRGYFGSGLVVGTAATGGDLGAGTINVDTDIYKDNTAYANPDYVFEREFTGDIVRFADNPGAADYQGLMPLDDLHAYIRMKYRLPGIGDEPMGVFERGDFVLQTLEEQTLYIMELHERIKVLEAANNRIEILEAANDNLEARLLALEAR